MQDNCGSELGSFGIFFFIFDHPPTSRLRRDKSAVAKALARQGRSASSGATSRMGQIGLIGRMLLWTGMGGGVRGDENWVCFWIFIFWVTGVKWLA